MKRHIRMMALTGVLVLLAGLAGAEEYQLDPLHSRIGFSIGHFGISVVKGAFTNFSGLIRYVPGDMPAFRAEAVIQAASINTYIEARDKHLRSKDFFEVETYPEIRYKVEAVEKKGDDWVVTGPFTMHGVTKPVALRVALKGPIQDPMGASRVGLHAEGKLNRRDFGVGADTPTIGSEVTLEIDLEAIARKP